MIRSFSASSVKGGNTSSGTHILSLYPSAPPSSIDSSNLSIRLLIFARSVLLLDCKYSCFTFSSCSISAIGPINNLVSFAWKCSCSSGAVRNNSIRWFNDSGTPLEVVVPFDILLMSFATGMYRSRSVWSNPAIGGINDFLDFLFFVLLSPHFVVVVPDEVDVDVGFGFGVDVSAKDVCDDGSFD